MTGRRFTAVAIALLSAALAAAGCGLGPGEEVGEAHLTVTRDYGSEPLIEARSDEVTESDTVMRLLERSAEIETRYGGGFVQAIEGLEAEQEIATEPQDWFFYVNGVESTIGAADYELRGGERIWWDYRDWGAAMGVPAVVGSWPQPFRDGYDGERGEVAVECLRGRAACGTVLRRLRGVGADATAVAVGAAAPGELRVLVGPWPRLRRDPAAAQIERGPQVSGVFAGFGAAPAGACELEGLDEAGRSGGGLGAGAGLVAATRRYEAPPVWLVTGCDDAGVARAAGMLDAADLRDRYAVAARAGAEPLALPLEAGSR